MNSFKGKEKLKFTFIIHKDFDTNSDTLEEKIRKQIPDKDKSESYSLVYIYYLVDKFFQYPCQESDVLYIGKTVGENKGNKKSAAFRFVHLKDGQDYKQNITLRKYYEQGNVIALDIYEVEDCDKIEKEWRYSFINKYGALPIADGASYSKEKASFINKSTDEVIEEKNNQ